NEIIFATKSGRVSALASDGTTVFETDTGTDKPVGSPVVYDWYDTDQKVVLLPAGNKLYGWNEKGELLPQFPFELPEQVTSPLLIGDINGDGKPEAFVATANRKLHALNGRGENLEGWPVTTNSKITSRPTIGEYQKEKIIFAFAGNAAHSWRADGISPAPFPTFIEAPLQGSPLIFKDNVLGNASDGRLYAMGSDPLFRDGSSAESGSDSKALYVSGSALNGSPQLKEMKVYSNEKTYNEPIIVTSDVNGSVFLFTAAGKLLFNTNMGQPADPSSAPLIVDFNQNGIPNILTLGRYGRLFVWKSTNGNRLNIVPSVSMKYPVVADVNKNGFAELIAQTDEGVRCWTI